MLRTASQGGDGQAESSRRGADDEGAGDVAEGFVHGPLLDEPHRLEGEGGEGRVGAAESRAHDGLGSRREGAVQGEPGEHAGQEGAAGVDDERPPREGALDPLPDGAVKHVAERGPDGGRTGEGEPRKGTHLPGRPTYFMTSTSSRITRPSVMSSSRSGRKLWIASSVSTMITAIGRSSDSDRMRVVWMWLEAPYPSTPRNTDAPARPAR